MRHKKRKNGVYTSVNLCVFLYTTHMTKQKVHGGLFTYANERNIYFMVLYYFAWIMIIYNVWLTVKILLIYHIHEYVWIFRKRSVQVGNCQHTITLL